MTVTLRGDVSSLNALLEQLETDVNEAIRPAAQAAAQVLYDAVKSNVAAIGRKTGNLDKSIYQAFGQKQSSDTRASYFVSWNPRKAPHGHLLEYGFIQRYASYVGKDGNWYTAVQASMRGKPKPKGKAAQAAKDAYYVARPGGPVQNPGKAFIRSAASKLPQALAAAEAELLRRINGR